MRYSEDHKAKTHQRIVDEAALRFRRDGVLATGLQPLMKALGLTHGGFYAHFKSKDDLVEQALQQSADQLYEGLKELQQEVNEVEGHFMMEFGLDPYQRLKPAGLMRELRADLQVLERENLRLNRELNGLRADPAAIKDWIKAERQLQKQQDDFDPWF